MCDTFIHLNSESILFGKNSDREPNEAQQIVYFPATKRNSNQIQTSYCEIEYPQNPYAVILSKPFQLWGAEMGCNEFGVTIGNEAVFTKMPFQKKNIGLTGMDLLRIALELSKSSLEAVHHIIFYLEKYSQDACGGYTDKKFYYHNSFLITDANDAYILETAGKFWVYKKITATHYAISNTLSIGESYDAIHPNAIAFAHQKKWISKNKTFNFSRAFASQLMPFLAASTKRQACSNHIGNASPKMKIKQAFQLLRTHFPNDNFNPKNGTTQSLCMHASGLFTPHQTTGSMVVELKKNSKPIVWLTGSAAPCLSIFKPFYFDDTLLNSNFISPSAHANQSYWWQSEQFHRMAIQDYQSEIVTSYKKECLELEKEFIKSIQENNPISSKEAIQKSLDLKQKYLLKLNAKKSKLFAPIYTYFWNLKNKQAKLK